jgi:arylsulfatase A-like enzyme
MLKRLLALAAALLAMRATCAPPAFERPPNIVVILVDALRRDHLPCYGYPKQTAPFLTRVASRGVVFEHAYSTSAWTPPAASSLFTSLYPIQHGVLRGLLLAQRIERLSGARIELNRLPQAAETIPEALRRRGYRTFAVTENPNLSPELGFDQGFLSFTNFPKGLVADKITARLEELRPEITARPPYFLYLHYMDVHGPYREREPLFDASLEGAARQVSAYDSGIFKVDAHIRRAWQRFDWDDALVVVLADHGEELGERGRFGHGSSLYAELLDIPLLVSLPRAKASRRLADPVSLVDVLPTLREAAGLPGSPHDEGVSLWPLLAGRREALAPRALFAHLWRGRAKGAREQALHATLYAGWKRISGGPEGTLLFDLARDPRDQENLAREHPEIAQDLQRRYRAFEKRCRKLPPERYEVGLDSEAAENLRALGYVQ